MIILFLFGIMLTRGPDGGGETDLDNDQKVGELVVSLFLVGVLATLLIDAFHAKEIKISGAAGLRTLHTGKSATIADLIFKSYVVPFEVVSILLLAGLLVGAVVIAGWRD